jgi:hypothetical protein
VSEKLNENLDFYYDENGNVVFTEYYHINKGHCCGYGCRHCPYQFESVPEPKRSLLLQQENA